MATQTREWISAPEAARMLQVHPQTVKAWAERGHLVSYQTYPGARHSISLASVEAILEARRHALARLKHRTTDGTAAPEDASKIGANFGEEDETGIEGDQQSPKLMTAFWSTLTCQYAHDRERRVCPQTTPLAQLPIPRIESGNPLTPLAQAGRALRSRRRG